MHLFGLRRLEKLGVVGYQIAVQLLQLLQFLLTSLEQFKIQLGRLRMGMFVTGLRGIEDGEYQLAMHQPQCVAVV